MPLPLMPSPQSMSAQRAEYAGAHSQKSTELFFYERVDVASTFKLCNRLRELDKLHPHVPHITLRIQSNGGILAYALLVVDTINQMRTPVHTHVDGFAASAATLISIAGERGHRSIHRHSTMLIHEPRRTKYLGGTSSDMDIMNSNMQAAEHRIKAFYEMHTRLRGPALDAELRRDLHLDASTCLAYGLVDHVIENTHEAPYFTDKLISDEADVNGFPLGITADGRVM